MSQTVVISKVNGVPFEEIRKSLPDESAAREIIEEALEYSEIEKTDDNSYEVESWWLEVGEGECGSDHFISDQSIYNFALEIVKDTGDVTEMDLTAKLTALGYDVACVEENYWDLRIEEGNE